MQDHKEPNKKYQNMLKLFPEHIARKNGMFYTTLVSLEVRTLKNIYISKKVFVSYWPSLLQDTMIKKKITKKLFLAIHTE